MRNTTENANCVRTLNTLRLPMLLRKFTTQSYILSYISVTKQKAKFTF